LEVEGSDFRRLRVYTLSRALARDLHAAVERWPVAAQRQIGDQLLRAVDSVGANIAEASGRWYFADQRRLLYIARGSLYETENWILVAQERGLLPQDADKPLAEIARTLSGLIRTRKTP
jgi:four helix bundle protein